MREVLCLATGNTYEMVLNTCVTAHPAVAPYPRIEPQYVVPIKKGGLLEFLYLVEDIIECLPGDVYHYKEKLTDAWFNPEYNSCSFGERFSAAREQIKKIQKELASLRV